MSPKFLKNQEKGHPSASIGGICRTFNQETLGWSLEPKVPRASQSRKRFIGKPSGQIQERVQAVGPEHFGVVSVDCAKRRSKWMLSDFYGKVLVEPTTVDHTRGGLLLMTNLIAESRQDEGLRDMIVVVEMTGIYHKPVFRACLDAGFDTRIVHPFASAHYRRPLHPNAKTDDHDLVAWAGTAAEPSELASLHTRQWRQLNDVRQMFDEQIAGAEQEMAGFLVKTPYALLLSVTGINVVSAARFAGEAGPIEHYASAQALKGRAGLFPSRYQSDEVDRGDGTLIRQCNRRLRAAALLLAENLIKCHWLPGGNCGAARDSSESTSWPSSRSSIACITRQSIKSSATCMKPVTGCRRAPTRMRRSQSPIGLARDPADRNTSVTCSYRC
ncbi:MAG: transposase [Pirellulaceae bacterium]|nr:transposase [Pirellulaceae bacterium]